MRAALRRAGRFVSAAAIVLAAASPLYGLSVQEAIWGFDGQVVPDRINILSVLVANDTGLPFNRTLQLYKRSPIQRLGATHLKDCFIAPFGQRWVQFHTHNSESNEEWVLSWGRGLTESTTLNSPRLGPPARVLLTDRSDPFARRISLKGFPEEIFPVTAAATDGLHSLVIDHVPQWEPVRRRAFLDWLHRGGTVHLLADPKGQRLEFPATLSVLNTDLDRFRGGAGRVVRHNLTRTKMDYQHLAARGFPSLKLQKQDDWQSITRIEDPVFRRLRNFTRADHNWWFIYIFALIYIVLIGPVNYLLGRKWRDYRLTILLFVGGVVVFSFVFERIGRRGHGESAAVYSLSYVRPVGPGTYDVTQWLNVFVTRGAYYHIEHPCPHNLYSTCQITERVNGAIRSGKDGTFAVDIPLYSSRAFLHRGIMKGPDLGLKIARWGGGGPEDLVLGVGPEFPKDVLRMWAFAGGNFRELVASGSTLRTAGTTTRKADFLKLQSVLGSADFMPLGYPGEREKDVDVLKSYRQMIKPLIAFSLGGANAFRLNVTGDPPPTNCVQVFIMAKRHENFGLKENPFGTEKGYVMYHVCLFQE